MLGKVLRERYAIDKELSVGGFGETYLAYDLGIPDTPKPKCVVKRLIPRHVKESTIVRLFKQEAATLYKLGKEHDQIPKLHEYFEDQHTGDFFLVQEFIDGHDLQNELIPGRRWSEDDVIHLLIEILEVLDFLHQQDIIHRDIKPPNIMRRTIDRKLVLIDFGAVKELSAITVNQGKTNLTVQVGTPGYMPNEQAAGKPKLSSDIFAVGVIAIRALTGIIDVEISKLEHPDTEKIEWRDQANVSNELAVIIDRMVEPSFSDRYKSAGEALQDIQKLNLSVPTVAHIPPTQPVPENARPVMVRSNKPQVNQATQLQSKSKSIRSRFLLWWIFATFAGSNVGIALSFAMVGNADLAAAGMISGTAGLVVGGAVGMAMGLAQWLTLRKRLLNIVWWIFATFIGSAAGCAVSFAMIGTAGLAETGIAGSVANLIVGATFGMTVGLSQWFVIKGRFPNPAWWIVANVLGGIIGGTVGGAFRILLDSILGFGIYAVVTGYVMRSFLRRALLVNSNN
ncbi:serine/threonine protein kinase [Thalassoporum mexicanum PCC 7367]|uniref:serine/threonine-protein kinase n=1 Tax=Thalassoporum mexicanum TaxID=3457544 RepID=UPI00029FF29D|nr:serine/threonine-protein kinase [Pseudanabaena sp. PCC 7367]AFY68693.1 serine/threonine protein kinase [Pseudanabaena sp. PCC 7367]